MFKLHAGYENGFSNLLLMICVPEIIKNGTNGLTSTDFKRIKAMIGNNSW